MSKFVLFIVVCSFTFTSIAQPDDTIKNAGSEKPVPTKALPVYVKIIWPVDPTRIPVIQKDQPIVESWITKSIQNSKKEHYLAVTTWTRLTEESNEGTRVWNGGVEGEAYACPVYTHDTERKDGRIIIKLNGWSPFRGAGVTMNLVDEPGSREVIPVTKLKTEHGTPHVAVFIGPKVE